jgi:hypothetical protein
MVGHRGTLRPVLGHKVKEEPVDRISSSWESARGETEAPLTWPWIVLFWLACVGYGVVAGIAVVLAVC